MESASIPFVLRVLYEMKVEQALPPAKPLFYISIVVNQ